MNAIAARGPDGSLVPEGNSADNAMMRLIMIQRKADPIPRTRISHATAFAREGTLTKCSCSKPFVRNKAQVSNLSEYSHEAVDAADEQRSTPGVSHRRVENALVVLDDCRAAELTHH
jgi:hypothetical protein